MQVERCGDAEVASIREPVHMLQECVLLLLTVVAPVLNDIARTESSRCRKRTSWAQLVEVPWDMIALRSEMAMQVL